MADVEAAREGHVLVVTMNRPERLNAISPPVSDQMNAIWDAARDDPDIWAAVLTGAGPRAFCAGWDLKWSAENPHIPFEESLKPNGAGGLTLRTDFFKPIIAAVRGYALGSGFEIALACDFIVAGQGATFGFPEPRVGNVAVGAVQRLAHMLPRAAASRILLACERVSAHEAAALGLVNQVVPDDQVLEAAMKLARQLCTFSPLALQATKALYFDAMDRPLSLSLREGVYHPAMQKLQQSADHAEGQRAFAEKREPRWTGQ